MWAAVDSVRFSSLATALVIFAATISLPAIVGILVLVLEPEPFTYTNVPFPVLTQQVVAGQPVTFEVGRCVNDPLAPDPLVYVYTVQLVNDQTSAQISLNGGSAEAHHGCTVEASQRDVVPASTPPGRYHVEGTTTATGRFRTVLLRFSSLSFDVE